MPPKKATGSSLEVNQPSYEANVSDQPQERPSAVAHGSQPRRSGRATKPSTKAAAAAVGNVMLASNTASTSRKRQSDPHSEQPPAKRSTAFKASSSKAPAKANMSSRRGSNAPTKSAGRPKNSAVELSEEPTTMKLAGRPKRNVAEEAPAGRKIAVPKNPSVKASMPNGASKPTTKKAAAPRKTAVPKAPSSKKAAGTKAASKPKETTAAAKPAPKRKAIEKSSATQAKKVKTGPSINEVPTQKLNIYVCGEGGMGELGLGTARNAMDVKRPRLNPHLAADSVGVVHVATGGMHCAALTHDNKILTWGVNDHGALGRNTTWEGGMVDIDENKDSSSDDDDDSDDDNGLNPKESVPGAIPDDAFPEGTRFVKLAAGDNITYAVTADGSVYGWGTFRNNEGILGFSKNAHIQYTPALVPGLKKITDIVCGANHCLALDIHGSVFAWGNGQQNQLGRRIVERTRMEGLTPREFGLPKKKIKYIATGTDHCFAIDKADNVYAWGLNCLGECGIRDGAGEDDATIVGPTKVKSLEGKKVKLLKGGLHHSVAVTEDGECLLWGSCGGSQIGLDLSTIPEEDIKRDDHGKPKILLEPTALPGLICKTATAESDHSIAVTTNGQAYSWGFSATYQTGQGTTEDIQTPTLIDNTALRGKNVAWVGGGGQFSLLAAVADQPNGQMSA